MYTRMFCLFSYVQQSGLTRQSDNDLATSFRSSYFTFHYRIFNTPFPNLFLCCVFLFLIHQQICFHILEIFVITITLRRYQIIVYYSIKLVLIYLCTMIMIGKERLNLFCKSLYEYKFEEQHYLQFFYLSFSWINIVFIQEYFP